MPHELQTHTDSAARLETSESRLFTPPDMTERPHKGSNAMPIQGDLADKTNNLVEKNVLPPMTLSHENPAAPADKHKLHFNDGKIEVEVDVNKKLDGKPNPDAVPGKGFEGAHGGASKQFRPPLNGDLKDARPTI